MVSPTWPIKKSTMYAEREDEYGSRVLNAWNQLGNCLVREGRPDRALDCYLKGEDHIRLFKIEVDDEIRAKLYLNIGKLFLQKYYWCPRKSIGRTTSGRRNTSRNQRTCDSRCTERALRLPSPAMRP